jgi:two-component system, NtrC family, sensor histidine kinase HydH
VTPGKSRLPLPSWVVNLAGFGLLIILVLAAFLWQLAAIDQDLHRSTLDRARMMAAVIEEHLANASQAESAIDAATTSFLRDTARFVVYLNAVDPLQPEELTALAKETGLLGIALVRMDGQAIGGPDAWLPGQQDCSPAPDRLHYNREQQTALLLYPGDGAQIRCIRVEFDARAIVRLRDKTALPALLTNLSRLPGIRYVRLDGAGQPPEQDPVRLLAENGVATAEARLATPLGLLTVGLDAANHQSRLTQLRRQFILFAALLLGLGLFFSWLFYRRQQADLARTRSFERILAQEHEAAALGRATATIAHEVRNPLNAINMGLQRLHLESAHLDADQRALIDAMEEAVRRAAAIISELQRFTRSLQPRLQPVDPAELLQRLLLLYQQRSEDQGIEVRVNRRFDGVIAADPDLLAELLENVLKNSLEAQPEGGFVQIDLDPAPGGLEIAVNNGGCRLSAEDVARMGDPYFTTKTRGTGLGLALCRRIAEAHGGCLRIAADQQLGRLTVSLSLPRTTAPETIAPTRIESGGTQ